MIYPKRGGFAKDTGPAGGLQGMVSLRERQT